jgi:energy-coupling factor transport system permease protein
MALSNMLILGQYVPLSTFIHKMDARIKMALSVIFLVYIFILPSIYAQLAMFALTCMLVAAVKVPPLQVVRGLKPILFLIALTVIIQIFTTKGDPLLSWQFITITKQGILLASTMVLRLVSVVIVSVVLTFSTSPLDLTFAMERFMMPFSKIGLPASEIALMMSIALRFVPTLLSETDKIIKAQSSRGADFATGGLITRAKSFIPVLIPLFVSAFRRADELANAMESRCFVTGAKRTRLNVMKMKASDIVTFFVCIAVMAGLFVYAKITL